MKKNGTILYEYVPVAEKGVADSIGFYDIINGVYVRTQERNEKNYYALGND